MQAEEKSLTEHSEKSVAAYQLEWAYPIWQLRFDEKAGLIAVECRDADTLQTLFGVFESSTGKLILRDYKPAKSWWLNLAGIQAGTMYLQGVAAKGVGRSVGITAIGIKDGQVKWQRPDFSFYGLTASEVLALPATGDATELISLNPANGLENEVIGSIAMGPERLNAMQEQEMRALKVPQHYPAENKYFADLQLFIKDKTGCNAQFAIDYLECKNRLALGFYLQQENGQKTYRLVLFSLTGEIYMQEILGKDLTGIGTDNFFIFQDTLILVKNKKYLLGYVV